MDFEDNVRRYLEEADTATSVEHKAEVFRLIASSYLALNQTDKADEYYNLAYSWNPKNLEIATSYAWFCFLFKEDYDRSLGIIKEAVNNNDSVPDLYSLHRLYILKGANEIITLQYNSGLSDLEYGYSSSFSSKVSEPDLSSLLVILQREPNIANINRWRLILSLIKDFSQVNLQQYNQILFLSRR